MIELYIFDVRVVAMEILFSKCLSFVSVELIRVRFFVIEYW